MIRLKLADTEKEVLDCIDQELFDRICEDSINREGFTLPVSKNETYIMILNDLEPIGFWLLYPLNGSTLAIHCNILKPFRKLGADAAKLILEWFVNECPGQYQKLNAEIPFCYPEVYSFTKKHGFLDEGVNRQSIVKCGDLIDQWRLGLTKAEAADYLRGD